MTDCDHKATKEVCCSCGAETFDEPNHLRQVVLDHQERISELEELLNKERNKLEILLSEAAPQPPEWLEEVRERWKHIFEDKTMCPTPWAWDQPINRLIPAATFLVANNGSAVAQLHRGGFPMAETLAKAPTDVQNLLNEISRLNTEVDVLKIQVAQAESLELPIGAGAWTLRYAEGLIREGEWALKWKDLRRQVTEMEQQARSSEPGFYGVDSLVDSGKTEACEDILRCMDKLVPPSKEDNDV